MLLSGVRLEACQIVEDPQGLRVELSGGGGGDRHEPVVLGLKPPVVLGHLAALGPVERVLVIGVLCAPPANRMHDGEVKRQAGGALRVGWVEQRPIVPGGLRHGAVASASTTRTAHSTRASENGLERSATRCQSAPDFCGGAAASRCPGREEVLAPHSPGA